MDVELIWCVRKFWQTIFLEKSDTLYSCMVIGKPITKNYALVIISNKVIACWVSLCYIIIQIKKYLPIEVMFVEFQVFFYNQPLPEEKFRLIHEFTKEINNQKGYDHIKCKWHETIVLRERTSSPKSSLNYLKNDNEDYNYNFTC